MSSGNNDITVTSLQHRAISLLGRAKSGAKYALPSLNESLSSSHHWGQPGDTWLETKLPFGDAQLSIKFDEILPRVSELALQGGTTRQARMVACEALHSLLVLLIGNEHSKRGDATGLYEKICPRVLKLGVDEEPVTRSMFRPLAGQLARWFAAAHYQLQGEGSRALALVNAAFDALGDPTNGALRDHAAETLAEFFGWSLKQIPTATKSNESKRMRSSDFSVDALLRRLNALLRHPDPYRRLGAAHCFNAIYRGMRENAEVTSRHSLGILESALTSLRFAHSDPPTLDTTNVAFTVVTRALRIVSTKALDLMQPDPQRSGTAEDLPKLVELIVPLCFAPESRLRSAAQMVFEQLAVRLPNPDPQRLLGTSTSHFVVDAFAQDEARLSRGLSHHHHQNDQDDNDNASKFVSQLECLVAGLQSRNWIRTTYPMALSRFGDIAPNVNALCETLSTGWNNNNDHIRFVRLDDRGARFLVDALAGCVDFLLLDNVSNNSNNSNGIIRAVAAAALTPSFIGLSPESEEAKSTCPALLVRLLRERKDSTKEQLFEIFRSRPELSLSFVDVNAPNFDTLVRVHTALARAGFDVLGASSLANVKGLVRRALDVSSHASPADQTRAAGLLRLARELGWTLQDALRIALDPDPIRPSEEKFVENFFEFLLSWLVDSVSSQKIHEESTALRRVLSALSAPSRRAVASQLLSQTAMRVLLTGNSQQAALFWDALGDVDFSDSWIDTELVLGGRLTLCAVLGGRLGMSPEQLLSVLKRTVSTERACEVMRALFPSVLRQSSSFPFDGFQNEFVARYFPVNSKELEKGPEGDRLNFVCVLDALMDVLRDSGSPWLLRLLYSLLREGDSHLFVDRLRPRLNEVGRTIPVESSLELARECVRLSLLAPSSSSPQDADARRARPSVFEWFALSLLRRITPAQWFELVTSTLPWGGNEVLLRGLANVATAEPFDSVDVPRRTYSFIVLECFFQVCDLDTVQRAQKVAFPETEAGNHVTKAVSKFAKVFLDRDVASSSTSSSLSDVGAAGGASAIGEWALVSALTQQERLANAVYSCVSAVVSKTQSQAKFFDQVLFFNGLNGARLLGLMTPPRRGPETEPSFADVKRPSQRDSGASRVLGAAALSSPPASVQQREFGNTPISRAAATARALTHATLASSQGLGSFVPAGLGGRVVDFDPTNGNNESKERRRLLPNVQQLQSQQPQQVEGRNPAEQAMIRDELCPIEIDAVSSLPIVNTVLLTLDTMRAKGFLGASYDPLREFQGQQIPAWVQFLLDGLDSSSSSNNSDHRRSINARLVVLKIVTSRPTLFAPLSRRLSPSLVRLMVDLEEPFSGSNGLASRGFHYLLRDVCNVLSSWERAFHGSVASLASSNNNNTDLVSNFVGLLCRSAPHPIPEETRTNIRMFEPFLDMWRGGKIKWDERVMTGLLLAGQVGQDRTLASSQDESRRLVGLRLAVHAASVGVSVASSDVTLVALQECLKLKSRRVSASAGEVLAYCIAEDLSKNRLSFSRALTDMRTFVDELLRQSDMDRWLEIISSASKSEKNEAVCLMLNWSSIGVLLQVFPQLEGAYVGMAITILRTVLATPQAKLWTEASRGDFLVALSRSWTNGKLLSVGNLDAASVVAGQDLVASLLLTSSSMSSSVDVALDAQLVKLVRDLALSHEDSQVRERATRLLGEFAHGAKSGTLALRDNVTVQDVLDCVRGVQVAALSDASSAVASKCFQHWDESLLSSVSALKRLEGCIKEMSPVLAGVHASRASRSWTGVVAQLLLSLAKRAPGYNAKNRDDQLLLFRDPLEKCEFSKLDLRTDAIAPSAAMTPLFLGGSSQSTTSLFSQLQVVASSSQTIMGGGGVVATQRRLAFEPTQQALDNNPVVGGGEMGPPPVELGRAALGVQPTSSRVVRFQPQQQSSDAGGNKRLVVIRSYRVGELIDIQIPLRDLVEPLLHLVGMDQTVARGVLISMVDASLKGFRSDVASSSSTTTQQQTLTTQDTMSHFTDQHQRDDDLVDLVRSLGELLRSNAACADATFASTALAIASVASETAYSAHLRTAEIDPNIVGEISVNASCVASGVRFLEEYLVRCNVGVSLSMSLFEEKKTTSLVRQQEKKRARITTTSESKNQNNDDDDNNKEEEEKTKLVHRAWCQLHRLYRLFHEEDVLFGVAERTLRDSEMGRSAFRARLVGDLPHAVTLFREALSRQQTHSLVDNDDASRIIMWASLTESLCTLQRWDQAVSTVKEMAASEDLFDFLFDARVSDPMLSCYVSAGLRCEFERAEAMQLIERVCASEGAENDNTHYRRAILESACPGEVVATHLLNKNAAPQWGRAEDAADRVVTRFIEAWASHSKQAVGALSRLLIPLQQVSDFKDFFVARRKPGGVIETLERWSREMPSTRLDGVEIWEATQRNRSVCLGAALRDPLTIQTQRLEPVESTTRTVSALSRKFMIGAAAAARVQGLPDVSKGLLKSALSSVTSNLSSNDPERVLVEIQALVGLVDVLRYEFTHATDGADRAEILPKATASLDRLFTMVSSVSEEKKSWATHAALEQEAGLFADVCRMDTKDGQGERRAFDAFVRSLPTPCNRSNNVGTSTTMNGGGGGGNALRGEEQIRADAEIFERYGSFCLARLAAGPVKVSALELRLGAIRGVLSGAELGNPAAINAIPRVLKVVDAEKREEVNEFVMLVESLPPQAIRPWTAQFLSAMKDKPMLIRGALIRLAEAFPQPLFYPFRVMKEVLSFSSSGNVSLRAETRELVTRLDEQLDFPVCEAFCRALEFLTHPEHRLKGALKTAKREFGEGRVDAARVQIKKFVSRDIFFHNNENVAKREAGTYNLKFAKDHAKSFACVLKENPTENDVKTGFELADKLPCALIKGRVELSAFSRFLDSFSERNLEVPCQIVSSVVDFGGQQQQGGQQRQQMMMTTKPITVRGFEPDVVVMDSLRAPKRITLRGTDERARDFLVKGGEDLRLDERIEQLFAYLNSLFAGNGACAKRELRLGTYGVVPVSTTAGMIEWIPESTTVLSAVRHQVRTLTGAIKEKEEHEAQVAYEQFENEIVGSSEEAKATVKVCAAMYSNNVSDEQCAAAYLETVGKTRIDALYQHLLGISEGPDTFLMLRTAFVRSLGALSVASYALGIGDRHLDNFLLGRDGSLYAIDFGYSFSVGVRLLPIPETTPFRLTPQFQRVTSPVNDHGVLYHAIVSSLDALRENRDGVLNLLDVFVDDPLVDWLSQIAIERTETAGTGKNNNNNDEDVEAALRDRVKVVELKLRGCSPSMILASEVRQRRKTAIRSEDVARAIRRAAIPGATEDKQNGILNLGANLGEWSKEVVSLDEQATELIRMATSPAMLMRQYKGARPWL